MVCTKLRDGNCGFKKDPLFDITTHAEGYTIETCVEKCRQTEGCILSVPSKPKVDSGGCWLYKLKQSATSLPYCQKSTDAEARLKYEVYKCDEGNILS